MSNIIRSCLNDLVDKELIYECISIYKSNKSLLIILYSDNIFFP
jgi:hypothetical protein